MNTVTKTFESDFGEIPIIETKLQTDLQDKPYREQLILLQQAGYTPDSFSESDYFLVKFFYKDNSQEIVLWKDKGLLSFGRRSIFEKIQSVNHFSFSVLYEGCYYLYVNPPALGDIYGDQQHFILVKNGATNNSGFKGMEDIRAAVHFLTLPSEGLGNPS